MATTPEQAAMLPRRPPEPGLTPRPTAAGPARDPRVQRETTDRKSRAETSREAMERYVASDRLEGMLHIPKGAIPDELEPRWVRIMRTSTVPDEENYQRAASEGYVELDVRDFPKLNRMRMIRPIPGFENYEIRGGLVLMVRDRKIGKIEKQKRQDRIAAQMRGVKDWVQDNPEEAAHRMMNPNFQRSDLGTQDGFSGQVEGAGGPSAEMFKE